MIRLMSNKEQRTKYLFILSVIVSAALIFVFNVLTPMMTDDLFYAKTVSEASSFWELIGQEYQQYLTWSGRSVSHLILRCFLKADKIVFNVANSLVFVWLTLLIYWNVEHKRKYDSGVFILINLLVWIFGVVFRQTVLWETGACNYLWGAAIILSFVTLYRYGIMHAHQLKHPALWAILIPIPGILAGWCNENTSGGGILVVLLYLGYYLYGEYGQINGIKENSNIKEGRKLRGMKLWMITGVLGQLAGFMFMILAPGNALRAQVQEEEHSGLFAYIARFQKITMAIHDNFLTLLIIGLILFIIICYQQGNWKAVWRIGASGITWFLVFLSTCYALVLTTEPMPRAYFGAGIFLIIAVVQFFSDVSGKDKIFGVLKTGLLSVLLLIMFFLYMDSGTNLIRIYREYNEREVYLAQKAEEGVKDVTIPMLRPDFETKYSDGYNSDIQEDSSYWVNAAYAAYYGFDTVSGVPREGWSEY